MTHVPKKIAVLVGAVLFLWVALLAIYYLGLYILDISGELKLIGNFHAFCSVFSVSSVYSVVISLGPTTDCMEDTENTEQETRKLDAQRDLPPSSIKTTRKQRKTRQD